MTNVTIGVPVWNGERYLETSIASLLGQTHPPDEIIISDNASTDRSAAIAEGLAASEPTIRVIRHQENVGAAANFNGLFRAAETELFGWLPHDDVWSADLMGELVQALDTRSVALAYGTGRAIDEEGASAPTPPAAIWTDAAAPVQRLRELFRDPIRSHLHVCNPVLGLMRRDLLAQTGLIRPLAGSDKVLIVEMALRGRLTPVDAEFSRRVHPKSSVRANPDSESRRRWFDPNAAGPAVPEARLLHGFLSAVGAAPISRRDRLLATSTVLRWATAGRRPRVLAGEMRRWTGHRLAAGPRRNRQG